MLAKSVSALAVLAMVAQASASAQPMPYRAKVVKMSVRELFGVERRQDGGYQPTQSVCGTGATCADACGAGYATCASNDNEVHCYNPTAAESCCPDGTGNSCDSGYYCTGDTQGETWCCPNGLSLTACAAAYSVTGALTSELPKPTTSSTTSSSAPVTTSTTSFTSTTSASSHAPAHNATKTALVTNTTTVSCSTTTLAATASFPAANGTVSSGKPSAATTTSVPSKVTTNGAAFLAPASALALFVAAGVAALL